MRANKQVDNLAAYSVVWYNYRSDWSQDSDANWQTEVN